MNYSQNIPQSCTPAASTNQGRRLTPIRHPVVYTNQPSAPQAMPGNRRMQVIQPKMVYPGQQYQGYARSVQTAMYPYQVTSQPYPYRPAVYVPAATQVVGDYQGGDSCVRGYPQGYAIRSAIDANSQREEKPPLLTQASSAVQSKRDPATAVIVESDEDQNEAVFCYGVTGTDWICVRMKAVLISEVGYKPLDDLHIAKGTFSFEIDVPDSNKSSSRISVYIQDIHIVQVVLCQCTSTRYLLMIWLSSLGRESIHLEWNVPYKTYDVICSLKPLKALDILRSKLKVFFDTKFRFVVRSDIKMDRCLMYGAILVERYARFLASKDKNNNSNTSNNNFNKVVESSSNSSNTTSNKDGSNSKHNTGTNEGFAMGIEGCLEAPIVSRSKDATQQDHNMADNGAQASVVNVDAPNTSGTGSEIGEPVIQEATYDDLANCATTSRYNASVEAFSPEESAIPGSECDAVLNYVHESYENVTLINAAGDPMNAEDYRHMYLHAENQTSDFPDDFLVPTTCASEGDTTKLPLPESVEPIQQELLDDDNSDKEELTSIKFDGEVTISLESIRRCMPSGAFMTGSLATFYFKHYIPYVILRDASRRNQIIFLDSDCYTLIRRKCEKEIRDGTDGELTAEKAVTMFGRQKKKKELLPFVMDLVRRELVVMPLFWDNHWMLGLLQMYPGYGKDSISGRLIIIDSKFNDPINKEALSRIAESMFYHIIMAIKAALIVSERKCLNKFNLIRCDSLPCQTNNSDCGWFMCAFAEHFTKNINWMGYSDEDVRHMAFGQDEEKHFYSRLTVMKEEIGTYMEKTAGRSLNFDYD